MASDESEIESSGEEHDSIRNVKRMKTKDKHEQRQLALGRKKVTSKISINIPNVDSAIGALETSALDSEEQHPELAQKNSDLETSKIEETEKDKFSKDDQYITIEALDAHKALSDGKISNSPKKTSLHVSNINLSNQIFRSSVQCGFQELLSGRANNATVHKKS